MNKVHLVKVPLIDIFYLVKKKN